MLIKDTGICLARREYSETSQIVTIFTRLKGKLRGIAKGARRAKSKFGGGIELLSQGQLVFSTGRGGSSLVTLTEWSVQQSYTGLRRNLRRLYRAYYLAELVDLFTEEFDPHRQVYDCFASALADLCSAENWSDLLSFQVHLLQEVGLSPELLLCARCGKDAQGRAAEYLSFTEGGILCRACAKDVADKQQIDATGLEIIRAFAGRGAATVSKIPSANQANAGKLAVEDTHARQAQDLLDYWIRSALNRQPKTAHLLR